MIPSNQQRTAAPSEGGTATKCLQFMTKCFVKYEDRRLETSNPIADALASDAKERFKTLKQIQRVNLTFQITMIVVFVMIIAAVCL